MIIGLSYLLSCYKAQRSKSMVETLNLSDEPFSKIRLQTRVAKAQSPDDIDILPDHEPEKEELVHETDADEEEIIYEINSLSDNLSEDQEKDFEDQNIINEEDYYAESKTDNDISSCNRDPAWTHCSKSCGLGMQVRYVPDQDCIGFLRETRLCHDKFCLLEEQLKVYTENKRNGKLRSVRKNSSSKNSSRRRASGRGSRNRKSRKNRKNRQKQENKNNNNNNNNFLEINGIQEGSKQVTIIAKPSYSGPENRLSRRKNFQTPNYKNRQIRHIFHAQPKANSNLSKIGKAKFCRQKRNNLIRPKQKSKIAYAGCMSRKTYRLNYCTDTCGTSPIPNSRKQKTVCCEKNKVKQVNVKFFCNINEIRTRKEKQLRQMMKLKNQLMDPDDEQNYKPINWDDYKQRLDGQYGNCQKTTKGKGYCTFTKKMELIKKCKCSKKVKCLSEQSYRTMDKKLVYHWDLSSDTSRD